MMKQRVWLVALLCVISGSAWASDALTKYGLVLLQPESVLQERAPDINALADYIKSLEQAGRGALAGKKEPSPSSGFIVVAVRPNQKSHIWLDLTPPLPPEGRDALLSRMRAVKPFYARGGTVVFALKVGIWGGRAPERAIPAPAEWAPVAREAGRPLEIGELVDRVWKE